MQDGVELLEKLKQRIDYAEDVIDNPGFRRIETTILRNQIIMMKVLHKLLKDNLYDVKP